VHINLAVGGFPEDEFSCYRPFFKVKKNFVLKRVPQHPVFRLKFKGVHAATSRTVFQAPRLGVMQ